MINEGKIYKITNKVNNKIYVGCTIKSLKKRFREHIARSKSRKYKSKLYNSMDRYGKENFVIELLETCSVEELYNYECKFIKELDTFNTGLNNTLGGEGCLGYKHTSENVLKCKEAAKLLGEFRLGKTYKEIYGNEQAILEKKKRSESTAQMWRTLPEEDNLKRRMASMKTSIQKSGYTADMILKIRELHSDGIKPRYILQSYPNLSKQDITNILDRRHFKLIYLLQNND